MEILFSITMVRTMAFTGTFEKGLTCILLSTTDTGKSLRELFASENVYSVRGFFP
jgi:hypothetical protein